MGLFLFLSYFVPFCDIVYTFFILFKKKVLSLHKLLKYREMAQKNNRPKIAADGTYLVENSLVNNGRGQNPKLYARILPNGMSSLYLRFYLGYQRISGKTTYKKELLSGLFITTTPRTPIERQNNEEILRTAEKIRQKRANELIEDKDGYEVQKKGQNSFLDYFEAYISKYTKKDIRLLKGSCRHFKEFLRDTPEYNMIADNLSFRQLSKDMVEDFADYLNNKGRGEGPHAYFARFKKVVKEAVEHGYIRKNPCSGVVLRVDDSTLKKDILSVEEIHALISTTYRTQNKDVRRAFLFSLNCGLRFCDVRELTFANIDYSNKMLRYDQQKTKGHSESSGVIISLDDTLLELLGRPAEGQTRQSKVFDLPSANACNKALSNWAAKAGIEKHITWHCARHSCAVNLLDRGASTTTVQSLLGHSSLSMTERYLRAIDKRKAEAISGLSAAIFKQGNK